MTNNGGRNLAIMGIVSIVITGILTTISLAIYHYSGDIYLDRSRPGYLPDEEEVEEEEGAIEGQYDFSKTGPINAEVLDEYLKNLDVEIRALDAFKEPFSVSALDDTAFGIDVESATHPEQTQTEITDENIEE